MPTAVLKSEGYITTENVVQLKGRVACEVNTCEELLLTEIVFENVLEKLTPHEIAGLLSCLICQEKNQDEQSVSSTPALKEACDKVIALARDLGQVQVGEPQSGRSDHVGDVTFYLLLMNVTEGSLITNRPRVICQAERESMSRGRCLRLGTWCDILGYLCLNPSAGRLYCPHYHKA